MLYGGARGGGKSEAGRAWLLIDIEHPKYRGLVIRKNADDLSDWVDKARNMYIPLGAEFVGKPPEIRFPSGAIIRTGHLKDENAYEKYQGHEYHRMCIEELTQIPEEVSYLKLISSCRSVVKELKPRIFTSSNPGGKGHLWVKNRFIDPSPPMKKFEDPITGRGRIYIPATIDDNPTLVQSDPAYMKMLEALPENLSKAWRYGNWDVFEGQYFTEWDIKKHTCKPRLLPDTWKRYRAIDFGRRAPFCCLWFAIDYDGRVFVYREYYASGLDADVNIREVVRLSEDDPQIEGRQYQYTVADASIFAEEGYGESIAKVFERVSKGSVTAIPSSKKRLAGWNIMHQYFRKEQIVFFDTCRNSIRTIPALIHDDKHPEDLDTAGEDHAADTIRYFLQTLRERKSKQPLYGIKKLIRSLTGSGEYDPEFYS